MIKCYTSKNDYLDQSYINNAMLNRQWVTEDSSVQVGNKTLRMNRVQCVLIWLKFEQIWYPTQNKQFRMTFFFSANV